MSLSYPSDLTVNQFELLSAFLPTAKPGGRPRTTDLSSINTMQGLNIIWELNGKKFF